MRGYVLVIYKSGARVKIKCKDFTVRRAGGEILEIAWDAPTPRPLHIGVDEIAAVYDYKWWQR